MPTSIARAVTLARRSWTTRARRQRARGAIGRVKGGDGEIERFRADADGTPATTPTAKDYVAVNGVKLVVDFEVHYDTTFGEDVCIVGSHDALGAWDLDKAAAMTWTEGSVWKLAVELPAGGVFFYKYVVRDANGDVVRWQDGNNSMLVLPESWNVPSGSRYLVEDNFAGCPNDTTEISQCLLASKLMSVHGEKAELMQQLEVQKNMTHTALEELLIAREELAKVQTKLLGSSVPDGQQNGSVR